MTWMYALLALATVAIILGVLYRPLGDYMAWVYTSRKDWKIERGIYKVIGVDSKLPEFLPLWSKAVGADLLSEDGRTATYEVTGPFQNGTNFTLEYPVSFVDANGKAVAASRGTSYENTVNLNGTDLTSTQKQSYVQYFDISVQMEPGFGSFNVTKVVEGEAAAKAAGKVRMEGKDYVMADGDVVEFRFNV